MPSDYTSEDVQRLVMYKSSNICIYTNFITHMYRRRLDRVRCIS